MRFHTPVAANQDVICDTSWLNHAAQKRYKYMYAAQLIIWTGFIILDNYT